MRKLSISAKCSDLFSATLKVNNKPFTNREYDGYVPDWFPGEHWGDYVTLDIDIDTGKILNWKKPTETELNKTFGA